MNELINLEETIETPIPENNYADINLRTEQNIPKKKLSNRVDVLLNILRENNVECELILCLFFAALKSYRADRCLRPFPVSFMNENGEKDFKKLDDVADKIPHIDYILNSPKKCPKDVFNLLSWLFVVKERPVLKQCSSSSLPISCKSVTHEPHYVFEVCYPDKLEKVWENRIDNREVWHAFHGSAIDNFYSILKFGLQQHFSVEKQGLYGNGIYLSSELSVCIHYAPFGNTWKNSSIGTKHSVIALCEIINDIEKVKCKDNKYKNRSINKNSVGEIPDKYFVVTDSDMVRVKYLLIYSGENKNKSQMKSFISKNFFWIIIILYFLMLVVVGFFNGPTWAKIKSYL